MSRSHARTIAKPVPNEDEPLWRLGQIAARLSVDVSTVRRMVEDYGLPVIRLPSGHRRIKPADFRRWWENLERTRPTQARRASRPTRRTKEEATP